MKELDTAMSSSKPPVFTIGQNVSEIYDFGSNIGQGNYGTVRKCSSLRDPGLELACKTIAYASLSNKMILNDVQREITIMSHLGSHQNLVELKGVHRDKMGWHLVMELCSGGELFEEVMKKGKFSEAIAAETVRQLASALEFCHSKNIVHRDVKLENVLLVKPLKRRVGRRSRKEAEKSEHEPSKIHVKLADFGLAICLRKKQKISEVAGSPYYMAPEVLSGSPYTFPADIWSLGVVLYALLSGILPFTGTTNEKIFQSVKKGSVDFSCPTWEKVSPAARNLVSRMLDSDPSRRPTAREVCKDPWIQELCTNEFTDFERESFPTAENPSTSECSRNYSRPQKQWKISSIFPKGSCTKVLGPQASELSNEDKGRIDYGETSSRMSTMDPTSSFGSSLFGDSFEGTPQRTFSFRSFENQCASSPFSKLWPSKKNVTSES